MAHKKCNLRKWFFNVFVYAGLTRGEYGEIRSMVEKRNLVYLRMASGIATAIFFLLFCGTFVVQSIAHNRVLYDMMYKLSGGVFLFSLVVLPRLRRLILPFCYLFLITVFAFAIVVGTWYAPGIPATSFCCTLVAMPLVFEDKPYRMLLLLVWITVAFCLVSARVKAPQLASLDAVNAASFALLAMFIDLLNIRVRMRELIQRCYIERERDTDGLTGLLTKAATQREIENYMEQTKAPAALVVMDIDHFKQINDTYGHAYGDAVIRLLGECIQAEFRSSDVMGRFGGDEFVLFLPKMEQNGPLTERIRHMLEELNARMVGLEHGQPVGLSVGIACYPGDGDSYETLFEQGDRALYASKRGGRSRCTFACELKDPAQEAKQPE